jgi:uncharacterized protein YlxP (DUF503 family)
MKIVLLTIEVFLDGCQSLKEKRHRIRKFRDIWGRKQNVAVIESARQDETQFCEWSVVVVADSQKLLDQSVAMIETELSVELDGTIVRVQRETL